MWSEALQMLARAERLHREVFTPAQGSQRGVNWEPPVDVLETNSTGTNTLVGGAGGDALIVNRAGTDTLSGGKGEDLFVLKESAGLLASGGGFNFGQQTIDGGGGHDTLRFIINDQNTHGGYLQLSR